MSDSKAMKLFTKLKRKGKFIDKHKLNKEDPRLGEDDHESKLEQLNRDAVKSLHIFPDELERRDYGFDWKGSKGLHPDHYWSDG